MADSLYNKHILLGVTGGIAAYKSVELVRRLKERGAEVRVVMTEAAKAFVTPLTFQVVSGEKVRDSLFDTEAEAAMGHIELAKWANHIVIAPATANTIASLALGLSDSLLTTLYLATRAKITICPAMNKQMWSHPTTMQHINQLKERGVEIVGPARGMQACGDEGLGRMSEVSEIVSALSESSPRSELKGKRILITAGPTKEPIDPVRYITNHSSGKMGYALAKAAHDAGAEVTLVSGQTNLDKPSGVKCIDVISSLDMLHAVKEAIDSTDIFIACAAVCDFQCVDVASQKIKKSEEGISLYLNKTPDILSHVGHLKAPPFIVGFAAETEKLYENSMKKLRDKNCDMVVANLVGEGLGFNADMNEVTVFTHTTEKHFKRQEKSSLAKKLVTYIAKLYEKGQSHEASYST